MNVVGKVGSLISQGVYSVATPFHPFGGAVDVIVVKQQDGTFRSTPWYVRFGKFQGVLKGSEKVVGINVNGNEADFHMYLDNSGEAYFVQELGSAIGRETGGVTQGQSDNVEKLHEDGTIDRIGVPAENIVGIGRLEHSVSDSEVAQLRDKSDSLAPDRIDRAESDGDRRYYELQDDPSSLEGAVDLSEFGSNRYESLDPEEAKDLQGPDSEVILFSVDGHVLTAPVSTSEQNSDTVRLSTPQFHLGPAESTEEFSSGDDAWSMGYVNELNASASNAEPHNDSSINSNDNALTHELEVCEGDGEHVCQSKETPNFLARNANLQVQCDSDETNDRIKQEDVFKSCLALLELTKQVGEADSEGSQLSKIEEQPSDSPRDSSAKGGYSSTEVQCLEEPCPYSHAAADGTEVTGVIESKNDMSPASCGGESADLEGCNELRVEMEAEESDALGAKGTVSDSISAQSVSISNDLELKDGEMLAPTSTLGLDDNPNEQVPEDDCSKSEVLECQRSISSEHLQTSSSMRFEISLCGKELAAGMGLDAAAKVFEAHRVSFEEFKHRASEITSDENLILRCEDRYLPWEKAAPLVLGLAAFGLDLPVEPKDAIPVDPVETPESREDDTLTAPASTSRRWRLWPIAFRRVKTLEHSGSNSSSEELFVDTESGVSGLNVESTSSPHSGCESPQNQIVRTNVPTSEQIASLNLKDGQNMITFSFSTRVLGRQQVEAHIYLWKWNDRIVISDVDGTITKSDVLGQFMPLVGKDWSQSGVAKLFSAIKENGYQLLFLSARAIVQAYLTRNFLFNLKQDGKTLPNGPVVISPDGLFPSLYREVIRRAPHEFKIACLEDIKRLFPPDYNPFYAGFGNRDTDELSYRKIGIPKGKIFIINPKGEVAISHRIDVKSYTSLHTLVDDMFPPTSLVEQEDYNAWNFWKVALPDIE